MHIKDTAPIPPEIKAANRRRALELAAEAPGTHPAEFATAMRTVFLPAYQRAVAGRNSEGDAA